MKVKTSAKAIVLS